MASSYTGKDITVLEGLDPVRKRPAMYIGGTGKAGYHTVRPQVCRALATTAIRRSGATGDPDQNRLSHCTLLNRVHAESLYTP